MNRLGIAISAVVFAAVNANAQNLQINEILFDPPGPDTGNEYIEIRGDPGATIAGGTLLIVIDGDTPNQGEVSAYFDLSGLVLGSNGLLVLMQDGSFYFPNPNATTFSANGPGWDSTRYTSSSGDDIKNGSVTFILAGVLSVPLLSDDIDLDDDANPDNNPYFTWNILDSVGVGDGGLSDTAYADFNFVLNDVGQVISGSTRFSACPLEYHYVGRIGDSTGATSRDWSGGFTAGELPAFNLVSGRCYPPEFDGQVFNHLGAPNPPFPGPVCAGDCEGDADGDGVVNSSDLVFVIFRLGIPCP